MKSILFPTEFSDHAPHMYHYALELAERMNAQLLVFHAFGKPESLVTTVDDEEREKRVLEKLHKFIDLNTPVRFEKVEVQPVALLDYPADAIVDAAIKHKPELIVLGMTGDSDDINTHLGSNALKVLRRTKFPVLALPSSIVYKPIEKLVFTTNFEYDDILVLNHLKKVYPNAHITVLHVLRKKHREADMAKMDGLKETFRDDGNISFVMEEGKDVEETIEAYLRKHDIDLLAMTSHKRTIIGLLLEGSLTRDIARDTKTPLYVLKAPD